MRTATIKGATSNQWNTVYFVVVVLGVSSTFYKNVCHWQGRSHGHNTMMLVAMLSQFPQTPVHLLRCCPRNPAILLKPPTRLMNQVLIISICLFIWVVMLMYVLIDLDAYTGVCLLIWKVLSSLIPIWLITSIKMCVCDVHACQYLNIRLTDSSTLLIVLHACLHSAQSVLV